MYIYNILHAYVHAHISHERVYLHVKILYSQGIYAMYLVEYDHMQHHILYIIYYIQYHIYYIVCIIYYVFYIIYYILYIIYYVLYSIHY